MVFQLNLLEKAYFIAKIESGPAKVRPASSDFWKAPLVLVHFNLAIFRKIAKFVN